MNVERARAFLLSLPHVVETMQWGDNLVFWAGDKAIGGKMFTLINLSHDGKPIVSYAAGAERFAVLVEQEDLIPAPYFARIFWVAALSWSAHREAAMGERVPRRSRPHARQAPAGRPRHPRSSGSQTQGPHRRTQTSHSR